MWATYTDLCCQVESFLHGFELYCEWIMYCISSPCSRCNNFTIRRSGNNSPSSLLLPRYISPINVEFGNSIKGWTPPRKTSHVFNRSTLKMVSQIISFRRYISLPDLVPFLPLQPPHGNNLHLPFILQPPYYIHGLFYAASLELN